MSFFDEGDEPRTRTTSAPRTARPRPRRPGGGAPGGGGGAGPSDAQQLLVRRAVALGLGVLVLVLLVVGVRACQTNAKKNALRDYNGNVASLGQESVGAVSRPFFALLAGAQQKSPVTVETQVNQYRVIAEEQAQRARALSVPGDVVDAQRNLVLALDLRAGALQKIADKIRSALGSTSADVAVSQIAGQMEVFLASDVLFSQRVFPLVREALAANGVTGQAIGRSRFLPDLGWLDPSELSNRLGAGGGGGGTGGPIAPGTHGHALTSVTAGTLTLQAGGTPNRFPASANPTFTVSFQNQGSNDERGVTVELRLTGAGKPITVRKIVNQTKAGSTSQVAIPLGQAPPVGTPVTLRVTVKPVPGETKTDNNTATYTAFFTR